MHELSFAQQVIEAIEKNIADYPGARVLRVRLAMGAMLALEPASLQFALDALARGTALEHAEFQMHETPPNLLCEACDRAFDSAGDRACPVCGAPLRAVGGNELIVEEIEIDEQDSEG